MDSHRDARSFLWLDDARRDLHYAARNFLRTPAFSAVAIVTIALGVGANVAIFSVVRAVMLQPLPYVRPERLVRPYENVPASESSNHRAMRIGGRMRSRSPRCESGRRRSRRWPRWASLS